MAIAESLSTTIRREVADYACPSPNATAYYLEDNTQQVYTVISVPTRNPQKTTVMVMAHLVGDVVIIDSDKTDHPLYEALVHAGVARDQIILSYAGEVDSTV